MTVSNAVRKKQSRKLSNIRKLQLIGGLFSLPALIIVAFATIIPVIWNVVLSFCSWDGVTSMRFNGISNFTKIFADKASMKAIGYSLIIALVATATAMLLGIMLSLLIYKVTKIEGAIYRFVFYSPVMLPLSVVGLLFTLVLAADEGLLNNILGAAAI